MTNKLVLLTTRTRNKIKANDLIFLYIVEGSVGTRHYTAGGVAILIVSSLLTDESVMRRGSFLSKAYGIKFQRIKWSENTT